MVRNLYFFFLLVLISQTSCSEFIEPSIKNKEVQLNSPMDNYESNRYNQTFWWEKIDNARAYHLQVVSPSFDSIGFLALDTIIKDTRFNFTFEPGEYEWRVRAENSGSETKFATRSFTIFPSSITTQQVQLVSPLNNIVSNNSELKLKWYFLYGATKYRIQVDTNNFEDEGKLVYNSTTANGDILYNLNQERSYKWRLRGENDTEQSKWSSTYSFTYDNTPPAKVSLISPDNNATISKPVELKWNSISGAKRYQVFVFKGSQGSIFDTTFPVTVAGTSYTLSKGESGDVLQWEVRALDEAGNFGELSGKRSLTIQ